MFFKILFGVHIANGPTCGAADRAKQDKAARRRVSNILKREVYKQEILYSCVLEP